jgi:hypothetical protein
MMKMRSQRNESAGVEKTRSEEGRSARRRRQCWMKKIWTS